MATPLDDAQDPTAPDSGPDMPGSSSFPWPPGEGESPLEALARTWTGATFRPRSLFSAMPREGGYGSAILYYLLIGVTASAIQMFWRIVLPLGEGNLTRLRSFGVPGGDLSPLVAFLLSPAILLLLILLAAGVTHVVLAVLGGARGRFPTTARVFAFSYSPQLFSIVPVIGPIVALPWMVVVAIIGLREAHPTELWRAALSVLIPVCIMLAFFVMALVIAMGTLMLA